MKIGELETHYPTVAYYPTEGLPGDGQPYVRMEKLLIGDWIKRSTLPPLRDAKTDPPRDDEPVIMYFRNGLREIGVFDHGEWRYFDRDEGLAVPQEPWEVVEKWSEILHW